jgi:hypothetical protein
MGIKNKKLKVGDLVRIHPEKKGYITADAIVWNIHGVDKKKAIGIIIEVTDSRHYVGTHMCKVVFNHLNDNVYDIAMNQLQLVNRGK